MAQDPTLPGAAKSRRRDCTALAGRVRDGRGEPGCAVGQGNPRAAPAVRPDGPGRSWTSIGTFTERLGEETGNVLPNASGRQARLPDFRGLRYLSFVRGRRRRQPECQ